MSSQVVKKDQEAKNRWWHVEASLDDALKHGLKEHEYQGLLAALGRPVNMVELGICSALYSEHCSYKSTRLHLKNLPSIGERVIQGPGENAGVVSIGDGLAVAFKVESHNHPSFIEPFQGAATGVGGILRDVFTMGARPLALLNSLRFGHPKDRYSNYLLKKAVHGIGSYGNCMGIPTIGGELFFHTKFEKNCLVNAFALGVVKADSIFLGTASGVGNLVYYVGSKTGRDGIHGATMSSEEFDDSSQDKRPTVQVGDPLQEKLLLEACLEIMKQGLVVGIQDMGAAGMTSSSFEMAERAGTGVRLDLDLVPMREEGMNPYEIMLSESQERMLMVLKPENAKAAEEVFKRWGLDAACIGEVISEPEVKLYWHGECISSMAASVLTSSVPKYSWPETEPARYKENLVFPLDSLSAPDDLVSVWYELLSSLNICSRAPLYEQYDSTVRGNTAVPPGGDAGVIRVKLEEEITDKGIAISLDCNSRYCEIDPYHGAALSVVESYRNVVATGALPIGLSDCLNYGSPEKPEGMWQIAQGIRGIGEAARALSVPVVSGNVSLYNETRGEAILPTPTIAMVGVLEDYKTALPAKFQNSGDIILLIGGYENVSLGGSEYLSSHFGIEKGVLPTINYSEELKFCSIIKQLSESGQLCSCHDVGTGGLAIALAESCFVDYGSFFTAEFDFERSLTHKAQGLRKDLLMFGEGGPRYLITVKKSDLENVTKILEKATIKISGSGIVGKIDDSGDIVISGIAKINSGEAYKKHRFSLAAYF